MAEHPGPESFTVNPPTGNPRLQAYADSIKTMEPLTRIAGTAIDFDRLTQMTDTGMITALDAENTPKAVGLISQTKYLADV